MPLSNDLDRLAAAEEYLLQYAASTQEFDAALEHVRWVYCNQPEHQPRCQQILTNVVTKRRDEQSIMKKLRSLS